MLTLTSTTMLRRTNCGAVCWLSKARFAVIACSGFGRIGSPDRRFDGELNEVLNLNHAFLRNNRRAVLDGFQRTLPPSGTLAKSALRRLLSDWNRQTREGELRSYCQVVVYWLKKRLA